MGQNLRYLFSRDCHLFKRLFKGHRGYGAVTHTHTSNYVFFVCGSCWTSLPKTTPSALRQEHRNAERGEGPWEPKGSRGQLKPGFASTVFFLIAVLFTKWSFNIIILFFFLFFV